MEHVVWRTLDTALAAVGRGADQLPRRQLGGRCGDIHAAGHARGAAPGPSDAADPAIPGRAGADVCDAGHVAGVGGERLRGRPQARVGL